MDEKDLLGEYKLVLGLEVHIQPKTERKMFCGCLANIWMAEPNTHTCPTCLGMPGALPVPNKEAVKKTQLFGLALNCNINNSSIFDRKHYFYPDLPKGYQISQYKQPLCGNGFLELDSGNRVEIERVHLEEDVAKSFHEGDRTLLDFNKSGVPLMELVTKPCFVSLSDAVEFCKKIQTILRYTGISDADMEKGQMRLEANVSLRSKEMEKNNKLPDYRVEIKNINSFRFMEKAVKSEIERQRAALDRGEKLTQENRGYNEQTQKTYRQRGKEFAHDYRYFPEPDIPPMEFSGEYVENLKKDLPELPSAVVDRCVKTYLLSRKMAASLVEGFLFEQFERLVAVGLEPAVTANYIVNRPDFRNLSDADFVNKVSEVTNKITDESKIQKAVDKVIKENQKAVEDYKKGKKASMQFLLGQVMRETSGKANPAIALKILKKFL